MIVTTLLAVLVLQGAPNDTLRWLPVIETAQKTISIDLLRSRRVDSTTVDIWSRYQFQRTQDAGDFRYQRILMLQRCDCREMRYQQMVGVFYLGDRLVDETWPTDWQEVLPNSILEFVVKTGCAIIQ